MLQSPFVSSFKGKSPLWLGGAATALAIAMIGGGYSVGRSQSVQPAANPAAIMSPSKVVTVTALGRLEPQGEVVTLSAPTSSNGSRVEQLLVQSGDRVQAGQVIAILDSRDRLQAAYEQAQEEVRVAQSKLAITRAGAKQGELSAQQSEIDRLAAQRQGDLAAQTATVSRFAAELQNAETEFNRYQSLAQEGAISASHLDSKRLALTMAQRTVQEAEAVLSRIRSTSPAQLSQAQANLDRIAEIRPVDIAASQAEVDRATAAMKQAKANLDQTAVRSPIAGEILDIHTRTGEVVSSAGIVDIGKTQRMYAIAQVYQSDVRKVKPGQPVRINSDSIPDVLLGTVERIDSQVKRQTLVNTDPSTNIDARVVEVYIALDPNSSQRAAKFTNLQVTVAIQQTEAAP